MQILLLPLMILSTLSAPLQTDFLLTYPLGMDMPHYDFPFQSEALDEVLDNIDPFTIATTQFEILEGEVTYTFTIQYTNEGVRIDPYVGQKPFISSFGVNDTHHFISLFNPTLEPLDLDNYGFVVNDTYFGFEEGLTIASLQEKRINLIEGMAEIGSMGEDDPLVTNFPIRHIYLREASTFLYIDHIDISETMQVINEVVSVQTHAFKRTPYLTFPEETYTFSSWYAIPNEDEVPVHVFPQPTVTPLMQAKAWAHYVMFGAGMNAAGRVEEAFRALETEYNFMDYRSQGLLFEEPNTSFQGINERGRLDTSSFREAVGRYNYLAARVPGATGLINPNPSPFPINTLILISLGFVGLFGIFAFIKSRYQRV